MAKEVNQSNPFSGWDSLKCLRSLQSALSIRMAEVERNYALDFAENPHRYRVVFDVWFFEVYESGSLGKMHSFKNQTIDYEYRKRGKTVDIIVRNDHCIALFPDMPADKRPTILAHVWNKAENVKVFSSLARLDHWPQYSYVRVV